MRMNLNPFPWFANLVVGFLSKYSIQQEEIMLDAAIPSSSTRSVETEGTN